MIKEKVENTRTSIWDNAEKIREVWDANIFKLYKMMKNQINNYLRFDEIQNWELKHCHPGW